MGESMRHEVFAALVLASVLVAGEAAPQAAQAAALDLLYQDADTGEVFASTRGDAQVKNSKGYSASATSSLAMWVEAHRAPDGSKRLVIAGQQVRYILPKETDGSRLYGPSDPTEPAYVGSPWKAADLRYREIEVICWNDAYWCAQVWTIEIPVDEAVLSAFVAKPAAKEIRVSLTKRRKVDWRVPRDDVMAVMNALDQVPDLDAPNVGDPERAPHPHDATHRQGRAPSG